MIIDTRTTIETPEGADLPLDPAGPPVRIAALLIDALIKFGITIGAWFVFVAVGEAGIGLYLILYFLLEWFYPVVFEVWRGGQTPGKKTMKIAVVNDDGTPVGFAPSLLRNLLRAVDFLPFAYMTGLICAVMNTQFKRVGDLAAGTMVIHSHERTVLPELGIQEKTPMPSDFTTDEQRALLSFAERASQLSQQRQAELASLLAPVVGTTDTVSTIKKMANSTLGGR